MPECVALLLAEKTVQDKESENWTLVNLGTGLTTLSLGQAVPFDSFSFWLFDEKEIGQDFGYQLYWDGEDSPESPVFNGTVDATSMQFRVKGLMLPKAPGKHRLRARIRIGTNAWEIGQASWPVQIDVGQPVPHQQA